jgi:hypothetical protein
MGALVSLLIVSPGFSTGLWVWEGGREGGRERDGGREGEGGRGVSVSVCAHVRVFVDVYARVLFADSCTYLWYVQLNSVLTTENILQFYGATEA